jgi:excisionase family DNA binding protein
MTFNLDWSIAVREVRHCLGARPALWRRFAVCTEKFCICEEIKNAVNAFSNYASASNEGRCSRTISVLPKRGTTMSMIEELRARTEPLNVKQVADLLGVAESTVQRWVRNREIPAIRIADTIRFDGDVLADRLERLQ